MRRDKELEHITIMPLTRTTTIRLLQILGILLLSGLIIAYAIWRSFNYARGPVIEIYYPANGSSATSSDLTIRGRALRINALFLNGNTVSMDQEGNWSETVIVFPGLNKLLLTATDQFGRNTERELDLVGLAGLPTYSNQATSTGAPQM